MPIVKFEHGHAPIMVDYTPSAAVTAGDVVVIADIPHVCHRDILAGELGALGARNGVYQGVPDAAIAGGVKVFWDAGTGKFTATAGTNKHFGYATADGSVGTTEVFVVHSPQGA